ncbi:MAG: FAD-binding oxidoreductase, partial [Bosea sp. (in: a-proteobacteria)]
MQINVTSSRTLPSQEALEAVRHGLGAMLGNRLVTSLAVRQQHANTLTWIENQAPDMVVYPETTEEVSSIVKLCAAHNVPV